MGIAEEQRTSLDDNMLRAKNIIESNIDKVTKAKINGDKVNLFIDYLVIDIADLLGKIDRITENRDFYRKQFEEHVKLFQG